MISANLAAIFYLVSGILLMIGLYPFFGFYSIFVFLATYFIDVDHYLWYVFKNKDFSLKKAYKYHLKVVYILCQILDD